MIKSLYSLKRDFSKKRALLYAKKILASNLAFALITIPGISTPSFQAEKQDSLLIPETQLNTAFNINSEASVSYQIPLDFIYMSQAFTNFHPAIDLAAKYGAEIKPIKPGIIVMAGYSPFGYGNEVIIDHGNGVESLYAHLSKIMVKKGDTVTEDSKLGLVGITGHSTGPHLHLEVHINGKSVNPLSVLPPINQGTTLIGSAEVTLNQQ